MGEYRTMRRQRLLGVVNRTCRILEVCDDGIPIKIPPGYRRLPTGEIVGAGTHGEPRVEMLPEATAKRALDQNKQRGTVNPDDLLDCTFLIGLVDPSRREGADESRYETSYVEDVNDPEMELFDRALLPEAQGAQVLHTGVGRRRSRSAREGGVIRRSHSGAPDVAPLGAGRPVPETGTPNRAFEAPDA